MNSNKTRFFLASLFFVIFMISNSSLSSYNPTNGSPKEKEPPEAQSAEEKKLLTAVDSNPLDGKSTFSMGDYYLGRAVEYDSKYQWGNPRKLDENQERALSYSIKAIDYLTKASSMDPNNATIFAKLTQAYGLRIQNGGFGAKLKYLSDFNSNLKKALEKDPNNFEALITKAYKTLYTPSLLTNRNKAAKQQFEKLLEKYPDNPQVTKGLAIACNRLGETDKAFEYVSRSYKVDSSDLETIAIKQELEKKLKKQK